MKSPNYNRNGLLKRYLYLLGTLLVIKLIGFSIIRLLDLQNPFQELAVSFVLIVVVCMPILLTIILGRKNDKNNWISLLSRMDIFRFSLDISYFKNLNNRLQEVAEDYKNVLSEQQGLIFKFVKKNGKFIHTLCGGKLTNKMGFSPDKLVGKSLDEIFPIDYSSVKAEYYQRAWDGDENICYEGEINGVTYLASLRPIWKNGQVVEVIASCVDITELRRTEQLLKKSEKLSVLGELAAGIAHEIRNPLTTLRGFVQLQKEHVQLDPTYVDVMLSELDRINEIVSEFLILSKPQVTSYKKLDPVKILSETIQFMEPQATLNNIQFHNEDCKYIAEVMCEENHLKQVFINVIRNAIEAMPQGGIITIKTELTHNKEVCIRIIDQGCGIPHDKVKKLGEPFYTTKEKGNGLGLMVSYKIIEDHKGRIIFESEENKGTCVNIVLPIDFEAPILKENNIAS